MKWLKDIKNKDVDWIKRMNLKRKVLDQNTMNKRLKHAMKHNNNCLNNLTKTVMKCNKLKKQL